MNQTKAGKANFGDKGVYYETAGEGTPLVFLHAGFVDSRMWDEQWEVFRQSYTVIRYDLLGYGRSDDSQEPVSRRAELYRVLEETGATRAILVGCSLGGEIVLDAALERPGLVSGLVVVSAAPGGFEMQGEPPKELLALMAAAERGDLDLVSDLQIRLWVDGPFRQPEQVDPIARRGAAEMNQNALAKGALRLMHSSDPDPLDPPAAQRLSQIKAPALIIAGELDNPEILRAADVMAGAIPGAQKVVIPEAAHLPNMDKPAEFNQAVMDFLGRVQI